MGYHPLLHRPLALCPGDAGGASPAGGAFPVGGASPVDDVRAGCPAVDAHQVAALLQGLCEIGQGWVGSSSPAVVPEEADRNAVLPALLQA